MIKLFAVTSLLALSATAMLHHQAPPAKPPLQTMQTAALALLATMDNDARKKLQLPFNDPERLNWHYVPNDSIPGGTRQGLLLQAIAQAQHTAALHLLSCGLSASGYQKAGRIRELELVLKAMEGGNDRRDPLRYYFTIFGNPAENSPWGWRYEGHHCSQNWTLVHGEGIGSSPQFFGANPAEVRQGPLKGTRVLSAEEDLARALMASLSDEQQHVAILDGPAPGEIITGSQRKAAILEDKGLAYSQLNPHQQGMLLGLIEEYIGLQNRDVATARLAKLRRAGLAGIKFAWMGSRERGQGHYYRVQGPTFLIEYDNTQDGANHIHAVWRDFEGDFGADLLAAHYRTEPHSPPAK